MNEPENYWYLASYPKSGNTWCRLFISELRRLAGLDPAPPAIAAAVAHTRFESLRAEEEKAGGFPERPRGASAFSAPDAAGRGENGSRATSCGGWATPSRRCSSGLATGPPNRSGWSLKPDGRRFRPGAPAKTVLCQDFISQQAGP